MDAHLFPTCAFSVRSLTCSALFVWLRPVRSGCLIVGVVHLPVSLSGVSLYAPNFLAVTVVAAALLDRLLKFHVGLLLDSLGSL